MEPLNKKIHMSVRKKLQLYTHYFSSPWRAYPNFLIIGAQKAGTTTLFHYLTQHPQVVAPMKREIHYFDWKYHYGSLWYRAHYPLKSKLGHSKVTGEKSPSYVFHPLGAERIKETAGDSKLILLLRDPVRRAISHYYHQVRRGRDTRDPEQAFQEEDRIIEEAYPGLFKNPIFNKQKVRDFLRYSYKHKGLYLEQIKRYHEYFPSGQMYVEAAENLFHHPMEILPEVYRFLGIDENYVPPNLSSQNVGGYKPDESIAKVAEQLREYFRPYNEQLFEYLGKRFPWE